jgi:hypothetical protein
MSAPNPVSVVLSTGPTGLDNDLLHDLHQFDIVVSNSVSRDEGWIDPLS